MLEYACARLFVCGLLSSAPQPQVPQQLFIISFTIRASVQVCICVCASLTRDVNLVLAKNSEYGSRGFEQSKHKTAKSPESIYIYMTMNIRFWNKIKLPTIRLSFPTIGYASLVTNKSFLCSYLMEICLRSKKICILEKRNNSHFK